MLWKYKIFLFTSVFPFAILLWTSVEYRTSFKVAFTNLDGINVNHELISRLRIRLIGNEGKMFRHCRGVVRCMRMWRLLNNQWDWIMTLLDSWHHATELFYTTANNLVLRRSPNRKGTVFDSQVVGSSVLGIHFVILGPVEGAIRVWVYLWCLLQKWGKNYIFEYRLEKQRGMPSVTQITTQPTTTIDSECQRR